MVFLLLLSYTVLFVAQPPDAVQIHHRPIIGARFASGVIIPYVFHLLLWPPAPANFLMPCMAEVPGSLRR